MFQFDTSVPRKINLPGPEKKSVTVRYPTDAQWCDRQKARKAIVKNLGRGQSETTSQPGDEKDLEILASIAETDITGWDGSEAAQVLDFLSKARVDDVEAEGTVYTIVLDVLGGVTRHSLRMPTAKQLVEYRRGLYRMIDLPHNKQEIRVNLQAAGDFYDLVKDHSAGYVNGTPLPHKVAAVQEMVRTFEAEFEGNETLLDS